MKLLRLLLLLILLPFSCRKSNNSVSADYFIVWGCSGYRLWVPNPHTTFFSISDTGLNCDTTHPECYYPKSVSELKFAVKMPDSQYAMIKDMPQQIPSEMLAGSRSFGKSTFDGGTVFIKSCKNGKQYTWTFESNQDSTNREVQEFYYKLIENL